MHVSIATLTCTAIALVRAVTAQEFAIDGGDQRDGRIWRVGLAGASKFHLKDQSKKRAREFGSQEAIAKRAIPRDALASILDEIPNAQASIADGETVIYNAFTTTTLLDTYSPVANPKTAALPTATPTTEPDTVASSSTGSSSSSLDQESSSVSDESTVSASTASSTAAPTTSSDSETQAAPADTVTTVTATSTTRARTKTPPTATPTSIVSAVTSIVSSAVDSISGDASQPTNPKASTTLPDATGDSIASSDVSSASSQTASSASETQQYGGILSQLDGLLSPIVVPSTTSTPDVVSTSASASSNAAPTDATSVPSEQVSSTDAPGPSSTSAEPLAPVLPTSLVANVTSAVGDVTSALLPTSNNPLPQVTDSVSSIASAVTSDVQATSAPVISSVSQVVSSASEPVSSVAQATSNLPDATTDLPISSIASAVTSVAPAVTSAASGVTSVVSDAASQVSSASSAASSITLSGSDALTSALSLITSAPLPTGSQASAALTTEEVLSTVATASLTSVVSATTSSLAEPTALSSAYDWIPTSTLLVNSAPTSSAPSSTITEGAAGATTTTVDGKPSITITSQASFPTDLPTKIVQDANTVTKANHDTTLVSILFDKSLGWQWLVGNADASGQVFYYTPELIAEALEIPVSQVQTVALEAYQPLSYSGNPADILTVFLAYIPTSLADSLQAMIQSPSSELYQQSGIPGQIASVIDPTFSVMSFSSKATLTASSDSVLGTTSNDGSSNRTRDIVIGVVVSCGTLLILIAGYLAWRATKRGAIVLNKSNTRPRERFDPQLRSFQLGGGQGERLRDSGSSFSSADSMQSTGFSNSSRGARGMSSSGESSERRSSWWRFSGSSFSGPAMSEVPNQNRRINVVRGPTGQIDSISRPVIQSNSLML